MRHFVKDPDPFDLDNCKAPGFCKNSYYDPIMIVCPQNEGRGNKKMQKILEQLNNKASPERWQSIVALEKAGQPAVEYLIMALKDSDKWVRYAAADALGNLGASASVSSLIALLSDHDQDVRFATAEALGKLGDRNACSALEQVCTHDNGYVKIAAEEALSKLR